MKARKVQQAEWKQQVLKVGDCVLVRSEVEALPYIGKILSMSEQEGDVELEVSWFYRPEEAEGGRKWFHGKKELFKSNHTDRCSIKTVDSRCRVHGLKQYQMLKPVTEMDYFSRFTYFPTTREYKPDRVAVYCVCDLPYNPDKPMIMCQTCQEWYHTECLKMPVDEAKTIQNYICMKCKKSDDP